MAEGGTFTRCPYCDRWVDSNSRDVVYDLPGMGQTHDLVDGTGALFHSRCPPEHVGFVRRPRSDK
jgi:hypothetical protein